MTTASQSTGRLRIIGTVVLILGLLAAGLVYALEKPPEDLPDSLGDPTGFKKSSRQMEDLYGKAGSFSYALTQDLKDPAIQAVIIVVGTVIVGGGFFWVAEMKSRENGVNE
jgi:hypothetical protein